MLQNELSNFYLPFGCKIDANNNIIKSEFISNINKNIIPKNNKTIIEELKDSKSFPLTTNLSIFKHSNHLPPPLQHLSFPWQQYDTSSLSNQSVTSWPGKNGNDCNTRKCEFNKSDAKNKSVIRNTLEKNINKENFETNKTNINEKNSVMDLGSDKMDKESKDHKNGDNKKTNLNNCQKILCKQSQKGCSPTKTTPSKNPIWSPPRELEPADKQIEESSKHDNDEELNNNLSKKNKNNINLNDNNKKNNKDKRNKNDEVDNIKNPSNNGEGFKRAHNTHLNTKHHMYLERDPLGGCEGKDYKNSCYEKYSQPRWPPFCPSMICSQFIIEILELIIYFYILIKTLSDYPLLFSSLLYPLEHFLAPYLLAHHDKKIFTDYKPSYLKSPFFSHHPSGSYPGVLTPPPQPTSPFFPVFSLAPFWKEDELKNVTSTRLDIEKSFPSPISPTENKKSFEDRSGEVRSKPQTTTHMNPFDHTSSLNPTSRYDNSIKIHNTNRSNLICSEPLAKKRRIEFCTKKQEDLFYLQQEKYDFKKHVEERISRNEDLSTSSHKNKFFYSQSFNAFYSSTNCPPNNYPLDKCNIKTLSSHKINTILSNNNDKAIFTFEHLNDHNKIYKNENVPPNQNTDIKTQNKNNKSLRNDKMLYSNTSSHTDQKLSKKPQNRRSNCFQEGVTVGYTYDAFFVSDGRSKRRSDKTNVSKNSQYVEPPNSQQTSNDFHLPSSNFSQHSTPTTSTSIMTSENRPRYKCAECGKHYATSSNLSRHKQTHR